ncbi:MAG TPA: GvpL/GvpF family gas vesicle protein [Terriglobales bacterium]|nr:GvpL/GvpF family gas vesicle protein [Terriglobales bacterium]
MLLLAYCVSLASAGGSGPQNAPEAELRQLELASLRCYYGQVEDFRGNERKTVAAALQFHRVNTAIFAGETVLPFRFPTVMTSVEELEREVAKQAERLTAALARLQDCGQMEVALTVNSGSARAASGLEYLKAAQAREQALANAAAAVRQSTDGLALAWKQRPGDARSRMYALVKRGSGQAFSQQLRGITLPKGVECRVVGPWPPVEFVEH